MTTQKFSAELTDCIIDHASSDLSSLKRTGLVSRQWYPRTRFYLFRKVYLRLKDPAPHPIPQNIAGFLSLVDASPFEIIPNIRCLSLEYGVFRHEAASKPHLLRFSVCSQLRNLSIYIPRDRKLFLSLRMQLTVVGQKFTFLSAFTLKFSALPLDRILDLISCLPTLESLCLWGDEMLEGTSPLATLPAQLNSLEMHVIGVEQFFAHLLSNPILPVFHSMILDNCHDVCSVLDYLDHAGAALDSLTLTIWDKPG